jgi:hypothetical protein
MRSKSESDWLEVFSESEVEELRQEAAAEEEVGSWSAGTRVRLAGPRYVLTPEDLAAQAAAECDQEQADRDYRELATLVVSGSRCSCDKPSCLVCRVRKWLAAGL